MSLSSCTCRPLPSFSRFVRLFFLLVLNFSLQAVSVTGGAVQLDLGEINVLVLTDVHSWVAGNPHLPNNDADYGDVLSFYEHLLEICNKQGKDLFFVMNGDFMDGTGLSTNPPAYLTPILQRMPWDAINIGNHELYKNSTVEFISQQDGFVDFWEGKYLTSNVIHKDAGPIDRPIGERYRFLNAPLTGKTILTFGFLYNFKENCEITTVEDVEGVLDSTWFTNVLEGGEESFDGILVLAHMDYDDYLVTAILNKIRSICGEHMPVQFITGHTHIKAYKQLDPNSATFEAGRYLDTLGLVSFPTKLFDIEPSYLPSEIPSMKSSAIPSISPKPNNLPSPSAIPSILAKPTTSLHPSPFPSNERTMAPFPVNHEFKHQFIQTSARLMKNVLGVDTLNTPNGDALSTFIRKTQVDLGLFHLLGCASISYRNDWPNIDIGKVDSLWGLYLLDVVPSQLITNSPGNIFIQNGGAFRSDLNDGNVTVDDLISTSPFNDKLYVMDKKIKGSDFIKAFGTRCKSPDRNDCKRPDLVMSVSGERPSVEDVSPSGSYTIYTASFVLKNITDELNIAANLVLEPTELHGKQVNTLWSGYINNTWICPSVNKKDEPKDFFDALADFFEEFTALKVIAFILTFIIIVFFGWMFVCRCPTNSDYSVGGYESSSDLSYLDDHSLNEFTASDTSRGSNYNQSPQPLRQKKAYHSIQGSPIEEIV